MAEHDEAREALIARAQEAQRATVDAHRKTFIAAIDAVISNGRTGDVDAFRAAAHDLAGMAGLFGAPILGEIARTARSLADAQSGETRDAALRLVADAMAQAFDRETSRDGPEAESALEHVNALVTHLGDDRST